MDASLINVPQARDNVLLSQNLVQAALEKFDQTQKQYENGLTDYIQLQESRQNYIDALSSLVNEYYSHYIALASLNRAVGE